MEPKFESNQAAFMPKKNAAQETELQKLNDELAKAEESFESMRRSMPLVPNSDYLGKMQAAASHIEQIKVKIGKLTTGATASENTNASISKFTISPLAQPINGSVAICSATFYNTLTINGIKCRRSAQSRDGLSTLLTHCRQTAGAISTKPYSAHTRAVF